MSSFRSVVGLTLAVIVLTCVAGPASASQKVAHREWLRSDSKSQAAGAAPSGAVFSKSVVVLAVLAAGGYFVWHRSRKTKQSVPAALGHVRVLSGTPVGPKARAVVAEVGGRLILLGVTEHSVRKLAWLDTVAAKTAATDDLNLRNEQQTTPDERRVTAHTDNGTIPLTMRGATFSEVLRDAVGIRPKRSAEPAVAVAEATRDRVVLQSRAAERRPHVDDVDEAGGFMDVEGQAAGLVARLNRKS